MKKRPVIIVGAGGHARVLFDILLQTDHEVLGFADIDLAGTEGGLHGKPILGGDEFILRNKPQHVLLANGVGSTGNIQRRKAVFEKFSIEGFEFVNVIHPTATISPRSEIGSCTQVMAGSIVQTGARISRNCIVNTGAIVEHDCQIESHVHLAPGVTLSGGVFVGQETHVGTGSTVVQGVRIGKGCMVAAGAVVISDVGDGMRVAGVPAREMRE